MPTLICFHIAFNNFCKKTQLVWGICRPPPPPPTPPNNTEYKHMIFIKITK